MNRKIKSLLVKHGIKQKDIAAELGLTIGTVSGAINGHFKSRRIQQKVAELLSMDYEKLWGRAA